MVIDVSGEAPPADWAVLPWHFERPAPFDNDPIHWPVETLGELVQRGVEPIGSDALVAEVLASVSSKVDFDNAFEPHRSAWQEVQSGSSDRRRYFAGDLDKPSRFLEASIAAMEKSKRSGSRSDSDGSSRGAIYVIKVETQRMPQSPRSFVAQVWNECLGARAIPFDVKARKDLIDHGSKHPELKRHIEAWKKMRDDNSKWVY
jgi:hypothetical protein